MKTPGARLREAWSAGPDHDSRGIQCAGCQAGGAARVRGRLFFRRGTLSRLGGFARRRASDPDRVRTSRRPWSLARHSLPVLCDADTGFGEALNVERTVRLYEEAGVAGLHLEDQMMPKRCGHLSGKSLIDSASMAAKIEAAVTRAATRISW